MAGDPAAMPASKLKRSASTSPITLTLLTFSSLRSGPTIAIHYRQTPTSETRVLTDCFPKQIAVTFSGLCRRKFPPLNLIPVADLTKAQTKIMMLEGHRRESFQEVIDWMLLCCEGYGVRPFKCIDDCKFWNYAQALEAAQIFVIPVLQRQLWSRIHGIAKVQVHSSDVEMVYSMLPPGHSIRAMAADSIGAAIFERRLKARPVYEALRQEFPDFNSDLNAFLAPRVADLRAENRRRRQMSQQQEWNNQITAATNAKRHRQRTKRGNQRTATEEQPTVTASEDRVFERMVKPGDLIHFDADGSRIVTRPAELMRKAARGRPARYKMDLELAGVTPRSFLADPRRQLRQVSVPAQHQTRACPAGA